MELIPRREPQEILCQHYQEYLDELKIYENNGIFDEQQRLKMLNLLMADLGIETIVKSLPTVTRKELLETLEEAEMARRCLEIVEKEVLKFGKYSKVEQEHKFDKKNNTLYIFFRVIDTSSIWSVRYKFYNGEFKEEGRFQAFACEDTLRKLLDR